MLVRTADFNDKPTLLEFEQGVISAERPFDPTIKTTATTYYDLDFLISSSDAEVAVVETDGEIIASGYAWIKEAKHFLQYSHYAYLGFMFVKPEYRGTGVNKLVLQHLMHWAQSKNIHEMRLEVYEGNEPAIKAYEKFGFSALLIEMRMEIK